MTSRYEPIHPATLNRAARRLRGREMRRELRRIDRSRCKMLWRGDPSDRCVLRPHTGPHEFADGNTYRIADDAACRGAGDAMTVGYEQGDLRIGPGSFWPGSFDVSDPPRR